MKTIPLTKGYEAIVDDEDFEELNRYNWCCTNRYASRKGPSRSDKSQTLIYMHRVIMNAPTGLQVDHIDGNPRNNQKANLRVCTNAENSRNSRKPSNNTSGFKGVYWCKARKKWHARITSNSKTRYLGYFRHG